jgi:hypothetical protein
LLAELLRNAAEGDKQILVNTHSPVFPRYFPPQSLIVCRKERGATVFRPLEDLGPLFASQKIEQALEETPLTDRILRGDFGG